MPVSYTHLDVYKRQVYNENGEVVDEGIIPRTTNARYHWSPNITLDNGWYTSFRMPGPKDVYKRQIQYFNSISNFPAHTRRGG